MEAIMPKTISKSKLKANMLRIFRELEESGEELIVTDNNRPALIIRPLKRKRSVDEVFGPYRGKMKILEDDINSPTTEDWEALQ
jgi:antitoxin (DNA-binding transcriptional repressor) of toxin-antitoxin stability system